MAVQPTRDNDLPAFDTRGRTAYVPEALRGYLSDSKNRAKYTRQRKEIFYPSNAGYQDPLTAMCVIDLVMRLRPSDIIRAKYLWKILQVTHPQVQWNSVVVGQQLNEIATICSENFSDPSQCPIKASRDFEGLRFKLNPTTEGWKWLDKMRDFAGTKAEETAKALRKGEQVRRWSSVWVGLEPRETRDD